MPILHFRVTKAQETISISRNLHAQNFTFRRAVVTKVDQADYAGTYKGGVTLELSFLQGDEFVSNINTNNVLIPIDYEKRSNDVRFEFPLAAEDIRSAFTVKCYNYDRSVPLAFGAGAGELEFIDVYFSFTSLKETQNLY